MSYSELWSQARYLAPYKYILDSNIVEFDIEKANISVLRNSGVIDENTYRGMYELPKKIREIVVGRMIRRHKELSSVLKEGIQQARHELFKTLNLNSNNVLSIKNDAVFVIFNTPVNVSDIQVNQYVKFKVKGQFRSFYFLNNKEFYYAYNPITGLEGLDIKGVGDYGVEMNGPFLNLLCNVFYTVLTSGVRDAYKLLCKINDDYLNKRYPLEYYRRLDSFARFDIYRISDYATFQADILTDYDLGVVDPSYNMKLLDKLVSYYAEYLLRNG